MIHPAILRWFIMVKSRKEINHDYYLRHKDYFIEYYSTHRVKILEMKRIKDLRGLGSKQTQIIYEIKNNKSLLNALERELKRLKLK